MNTATSNRRLLKLAAFLRTVPRSRFNYGHWIGSSWKGSQDLSCGTSACAIGWAATVPAFRKLGMRIVRDFEGDAPYVTLKQDKPVPESDVLGRLGYANTASLIAAMVVFGLHEIEARHLFMPDRYEARATAKQVAKKIEKYVAMRTDIRRSWNAE